MSAARFAAFAALYGDHYRPLWAYLVRLGAGAAAEDIAQESFLRWLDRGTTAEPPAARAFLFTTATRLLTDRWRRERRYVAWDEEAAPAAEAGEADAILGEAAWAGLSARERQLLWLAHGEEFSHAEIAAIAGVAPASIRVLLSRARAKLAANLARAGAGDD